ncbi:MAG TPA: DUF2155 domain-containing protein [Beijerinckiaceae bacterium]|nr:DUF2155 domain-containing protein [Beijerinckiaceae bacterium]
MPRFGFSFAAAFGLAVLASAPGHADKIKNPVAVFAGLDKITGRIIAFEVAINETVQFGSLQLTPRVCYSRPPYETPRTDVFVEVEEVTFSNEYKRIFTGWMFAASPGLNAVEHAVYDLWLTDCKGGTDIIKVAPEKEEEPQIMPVETKRPARPVQPLERKADSPLNRPQPSQSFFPTNQPPAIAPPPAAGNRPLVITPAGKDPAGSGN